MQINEIHKFIKDKKRSGENIKILKTQPDNDFTVQNKSEFVKRKNVSLIEGSELSTKKVEINSTKSGFAYFLDGIERKRILFNYNFIPVTYGYVSAVIMQRIDKKMHSIGLEESRENLYLPLNTSTNCPGFYFNRTDFSDYKFNVVNTGEMDKTTGNYPQYPIEFEQKAHSDIQETRGKLERALAKKWLSQDNKGWLFVDGRLENKSSKILEADNIAGIIKSHHVNYFDYKDQIKIYHLKKGEKSSVFQPEGENIYSWYVRLHESKTNGKEDFGIIRIEIPASENLLNKVDEITTWLMLETMPVAFPASRWDRMIYPIKYCEDYLKSKAPSWTMIESLS